MPPRCIYYLAGTSIHSSRKSDSRDLVITSRKTSAGLRASSLARISTRIRAEYIYTVFFFIVIIIITISFRPLPSMRNFCVLQQAHYREELAIFGQHKSPTRGHQNMGIIRMASGNCAAKMEKFIKRKNSNLSALVSIFGKARTRFTLMYVHVKGGEKRRRRRREDYTGRCGKDKNRNLLDDAKRIWPERISFLLGEEECRNGFMTFSSPYERVKAPASLASRFCVFFSSLFRRGEQELARWTKPSQTRGVYIYMKTRIRSATFPVGLLLLLLCKLLSTVSVSFSLSLPPCPLYFIFPFFFYWETL